jgi:3-hydroxyacyl-CoA dehydrogenase
MATAAKLFKNAVINDRTPQGFVVNRILAKVLGEAMQRGRHRYSSEARSRSTKPFGPDDSLRVALAELVGLTVGAHVLDTHHAAFPELFLPERVVTNSPSRSHLERDSKGRVTGVESRRPVPSLLRGTTPMTADELRTRIERPS